jgi:hypothetical protein
MALRPVNHCKRMNSPQANENKKKKIAANSSAPALSRRPIQ